MKFAAISPERLLTALSSQLPKILLATAVLSGGGVVISHGLSTEPAAATMIEVPESELQAYGEAVEPDSYIGAEYVGSRISELPGSLESLSGWIVYESNEPLEFGVSHVRDSETGRDMLFFDYEIGRATVDNRNQAIWTILDVVELPSWLPESPADYEQVQANLSPFCYLNGDYDPELVAIVDTSEFVEFYPATDYVWRANRQTGQIEAVSAAGVTCANQGWGL